MLSLPVVLLLALSINTQALAFGKVGHRVACELAYQSLSAVNQHKVDNLLRLIPREHQKLINSYAREKKTAQVTFANACLWADAIKSHKSFSIIYKAYKPWHYLNVERDTRAITKESCFENCISAAITFHFREFQQKNISWPKTQALLFLGHWLADVHQPMHVSFASDFGGNKLKIQWLSDSGSQSKNKKVRTCKNMHELWDDCLLRFWQKKTHDKLLFALHIKALSQKISELTAADRELIVSAKPWLWANESLAIARDPQVKYCQQQAENDFCLPFRVNTMYLLPDYHQQFAPVALDRLMYAGLRLGHMLKQAL